MVLIHSRVVDFPLSECWLCSGMATKACEFATLARESSTPIDWLPGWLFTNEAELWGSFSHSGTSTGGFHVSLQAQQSHVNSAESLCMKLKENKANI